MQRVNTHYNIILFCGEIYREKKLSIYPRVLRNASDKKYNRRAAEKVAEAQYIYYFIHNIYTIRLLLFFRTYKNVICSNRTQPKTI